MRSIFAAWIVFGVFVSPCLAAVAVLEGPIVDPGNGHTFYLLDTDTWKKSENQAESMGGFLATIRNADENQWIFDTFRGPAGDRRDMWIGLYDPTTDDGTGNKHQNDFVWISGESVTYTNWNTNEPNNDPNNGGEYYGSLTGFVHDGQNPGNWNDKNNGGTVTPSYGVVEIVPEPIGVAMFGVVLLILKRRK